MPLLVAVMREGRRLTPAEPLAEASKRCTADLARLPEAARALHEPIPPPVRQSPSLAGCALRCEQRSPWRKAQLVIEGASRRTSGEHTGRHIRDQGRWAPRLRGNSAGPIVRRPG
ncbi:hypothetical protein ACIBO5_21480 [Nonomuraea angiospora]|uniref:hypothetical protein n=1 Tax=Nonomuraea angiospora TaxID=46172 RepID=UPI00378C10DA